MRKRLLIVALLAAVTLMFGLAGCGSGDTEGREAQEAQEDVEGLPAWADEAAVTAQARDAIDLFVAGDYEGLASLFGDPAPAASDFEKAARAAEDVGGFESYGDVSFAHYDGGADGMATTWSTPSASPRTAGSSDSASARCLVVEGATL